MTPSKEELWLLCLKGNCTCVNDKGLDILQKCFCEFFQTILSISNTLAGHECRVTITTHDIIQSQEVMFRQRENCAIRMSGFLLNATVSDECSDDMSVDEQYKETSSVSTSDSESDNENDDEGQQACAVEEKDKEEDEGSEDEGEVTQMTQEMSQELRIVFEIESDADIDEIEADPEKKKLITPRLISSSSYLHLFKSSSPTKFITVAAFNMLAAVCEHQVHLNALGGDSLLRVVHEGMIVPLPLMLRLTQQEEEAATLALTSKYLGVEQQCLSSLREARIQQRELMGVLQRLLVSSGSPAGEATRTPSVPSTADTSAASSPSSIATSSSSPAVSTHRQERDTILLNAALRERLAEEEARTSFLKERLEDVEKRVRTLQDVVKEANEMAFSLRTLTAPRSTATPLKGAGQGSEETKGRF